LTPIPIQPAVLANWSGPIDAWFRPFLRGETALVPAAPDEQWQHWLRSMEAHGLLPLLSRWLLAAGSGTQLPTFVQTHLQQAYAAAMTEAACRWLELKQLLAALAEVRVRPLVLKGTALAESYYPRPELRPSNDIDLLVRREQYPAARQALLAHGYRLNSGDRSQQMEWNNQELFVFGRAEETRQYAVELHWSLSAHTRILQNLPVNLLFERAISLNGAGQTESPQVLCPADALAYAALHLIYSHYLSDPASVRLIWLYDVNLLVRQIEDEAGWRDVLVASQRLEARLALLDTFTLAQAWFGSPIPAVVADLTYYPPSDLERELHDVSRSDKSGRLKRHFLRLSGLNRREQLRYLSNRLFPDRHELHAAYPRLRRLPLPLAYLARPFLSFRRKP
jgi:hypothetical protein